MHVDLLKGVVLLAAVTFSAPRSIAEEESQSSTPVFWAEERSEQVERIHQALCKPLPDDGFEFRDAPLAEVIDIVRDDFKIEVQLDLASLEDLGLTPDDPVNVNLRNISLGAALEIMLKQLDLTYVVDNEMLLVTTEEEALTRLTVAVYPVGDILANKSPAEGGEQSETKPQDMDRLIDSIVSCVAPDTWVENGGPEAEIRPMQPGLLVISQTQDVHEQIRGLLSALRRARQHESAVPHQEKSWEEDLEEEGGGLGGGGGGVF